MPGWRAAILLLAGTLAGCGGDRAPEALQEYFGSFRAPVGSGSPTVKLRPFPARGQLRAGIPHQTVGVFGFLRLQGRCSYLASLVGGRNSALGKLLPDSGRLIYEHRFLSAAEACLAALRDEGVAEELQAALLAALAAKRDALSALFWNATVAGPEWPEMMSLSSGGALGTGELRRQADSLIQALDYLADLHSRLGTEAELDPDALEASLAILRDDAFGGRLLKSLLAALEGLHRANQVLGQAAIACGDLAQVADSAMRREAQAYLQQLAAVAESFGDALLRVVDLPLDRRGYPLSQRFALFQAYRRSFLDRTMPDSLPAAYLRALQRHRQLWAGALRACA